jgi:ribosomal protein S18 acetylase RimI-like enzyme
MAAIVLLQEQPMEICNCTKDDFDQIISDIKEFWGNDRTLPYHHHLLIYEFGNSAFVIRESNKVIAYLCGFLSQTGPEAYVHLIGVRNTHRRQGLGQRLYEHFIGYARSHGCNRIRAITTPENLTSIAFHKSIGMKLTGEPNKDGIAVIKDYRGPGADRVVFEREI